MIRHAVKRQAAASGGRGGFDGKRRKIRGWNKDKPVPVSREAFIATGVRFLAGNATKLGAEWDAMNEQWEKNREERRMRRENGG